MKECSAFSKTICSICFEDLKPIEEDLQAISICGHVFHELCVQQWFEYCSKAKKITCPVCKQRCTQEKAYRLYFQSIGDSVPSQKPFGVEVEDDPKELSREVKRLEGKLSGITSSFERQQQDLKELNEELCICQEKAKKEEALKDEALRQKALIQHLFNSKSEERNLALAKELAALKLVSDLNLGEEDVVKLASFGHEANSKDTIDILKKSLVLRNKSYKELLAHCNLLGRGESRHLKKLEKSEAKIKRLKSRVQELETALEQKDNEVLRSLKASNITSGKGFDVSDRKGNCSSSFSSKFSSEIQMDQPVELVENSNRTGSLTNDPCHSRKTVNSKIQKDLVANTFNKEANAIDLDQGRHSFIIEEDVLELNTALPKKPSPDLKPQMPSRFSGSAKSSLSSPSSACDTNRAWGHGQSSWVGLSASCNDTKNDTDNAYASVMKDDVVLLSDDIKELPLLNIKKETPCSASISNPGGQCFAGGLLGPDGTNRFLGKWCKRVQSKEPASSPVMQGSDNSVGNLIAVGADGRGGRVKVLRSQRESSLDSKESKLWAKKPKCGAKLSGQQSQGYLQIEHFFAKSGQ
ncbi:uncharacterized protein LOC122663956 isoform X2 [Telopea speciosissima]|uniref:uncharacterized protein LOC122663956 isoform X2 n=1 Tax=Telopea speciosissima TaxID=54955 RepID=UPI001CC3B4EC|nr:uncharacterized protein LOC122663956 isoform X2 [Telopea speciosissima]